MTTATRVSTNLSNAPAIARRLTAPPPAAIAAALGITQISIDWLAGDGSDRCYYRITAPEKRATYVLMQLSGSDLENLRSGSYDWVEIGDILRNAGVVVPKALTVLSEYGALIIDDYGDEMLETTVLLADRKGSISDALPLYRRCLSTLSNFIAIRPEGNPSWTKRSFDAERFIWELDFFVTKYLEGVCGRTLSSTEKLRFTQDSRALASFLASGSKYFVHRDFHSRNVMVWGGDIAVIDFQDARLGPVTYDLVSLCFDSYVPFSGRQRIDLLDQGLELFGKRYGNPLLEEAKSQWKPLLLQRQLKAIGSFGYLTIDKDKGDYLKNVGPALQTLLEANLSDSRWPFLSGELLQVLAETLPVVQNRLNKPRTAQAALASS